MLSAELGIVNHPACRALGDRIEQAGLDRDTLHEILWQINAHPELFGFRQVCQNLDGILQAMTAVWETPLTDWGLETWPALVSWIGTHRDELDDIFAGETLSSLPTHERRNPMIGNGVARYPLHGALWCASGTPGHPSRYQLLQAHCLVAYTAAMRQYSSRARYEAERHTADWCPFPQDLAAFGRALRYASLSSPAWTAYLEYLPVQEPPWAFVEALVAEPPETCTDVTSYHNALRLFLQKVFAGRKWIHRDRPAGPHQIRKDSVWAQSYGGGGGSSTRQRVRLGDPDDPDCSWGHHELVHQVRMSNAERAELFRVDEDAAEDEEPPLPRTSAAGAGGQDPATHAASSQAQLNHILLDHQCLPWEYNTLTEEEIRFFVKTSSDTIQLFARKDYLTPAERDHLEVLALAHVLLTTGTPLERALPLVVFPSRMENEEALFALQGTSDINGAGDGELDCWSRQALVPAYCTERTASGERKRSRVLSLPDVVSGSTGLRVLLAQEAKSRDYRFEEGMLPLRPFRHTELWYRRAFRHGLTPYDRTGRLTPTRLANALFFRLVQQSGGDVAAAALITGQPHPLARVRLYYATPPIRDLQQAYIQAVTSLIPNRPTPAGLRMASPDLSVGSRLCPTRATVRDAIGKLREAIRTARRATDFEGFTRYHNLYSLYSVAFFAYATGVRGVRTPYRSPAELDLETGIGQLREKDRGTGRKTRLIWVPPAVLTQMRHYQDHLEAVCQQLGIAGNAADKPCFFLDSAGRSVEVRPKTLESVMGEFLDYPSNMHRRFLRTEMLASQCAPEVVDYWMGHWHLGEEPWGPYSSLSFAQVRRALAQHLLPILEDLGFQPLRSRLGSGDLQIAQSICRARDEEPKTHHKSKSTLPAAPRVIDSPFGDPDALGLSEAQAELLPAVWAWLEKQTNPAARALCGSTPAAYTESDATVLDAALLESDFGGASVTAEYLRIIGKIVVLKNERERAKVPALPLPHRLFLPAHPVQSSVAVALRRVRLWREVLDQWIRTTAYQPCATTNGSPPVDLASVLLSAVLYGGLLHRTSLAALTRVLISHPESIGCSGGQVHLDLSLSWGTAADAERRRWYPDPVSANLLLRLSPQAAQEQFAAAFSDGVAVENQCPLSDQLLSRGVWRILAHAFQRQTLPQGARPRSLADLLEAVSLVYFTELPPLLVAYATRQWVSHSVKPEVLARWQADSAPAVPRSVPSEQRTARSRRTREQTEGTSKDDGGDVVPSWVNALRRALAGADADHAREQVRGLQEQSAEAPTIAHCLRDFADFALAKNASSEYPSSLRQLRARILRVAQHLGCIVGNHDVTSWSIEAIEALYTQVLENVSQTPKAALARWNMTVALRAFHHYLSAVHGVTSLASNDLLRLGRGLLPVDGTVMSLEEYGRILEGLQQIDRHWATPLPLSLKRVAILLVILGFRCGLRRKEALQLKRADLCLEGAAELLIRRSFLRDLKTPNATRKLPLHALLTGEEMDQLRQWTRDRDAQESVSGKSYLFGIPELNFPFVPEDTIYPLILQVMREVTGSPLVRFHHLRHSFASWTLLRLLLADQERIPTLLPQLPQTTDWLKQSHEFRRILYGHELPTRKHGYAVTSLLGHSSPDVSLEHYIHCLDWSLGALISASSALAPAASLVTLASGEPSSSVHRWMLQEGPAMVPARLYRFRFPQARGNARRTGGADRPESSDPGDDWVWSTWRGLYRHQTERVPLSTIAEESFLPLAEWELRLEQAQHLRDLRAGSTGSRYRHRMVAFVRDRRSRHVHERLSCPTYPHLETDQKWVRLLAPHLRELIETDAALVRRVVDDYSRRVRRRDNLLRFRSPRQAATARDYLTFLEALGICREEIRFVSFDRAQRSQWIPQWRGALGLNWRVTIHKPTPGLTRRAAPESFALEPVLEPQAKNQRNNATGSYGFRFLMLIAFIVWTGKPAVSIDGYGSNTPASDAALLQLA